MKHPLHTLYGPGAIIKVAEEIESLQAKSNFNFSKEYREIGISFVITKAEEIVKENRQKPSLESLVCESFGEAAICYFQVLKRGR